MGRGRLPPTERLIEAVLKASARARPVVSAEMPCDLNIQIDGQTDGPHTFDLICFD